MLGVTGEVVAADDVGEAQPAVQPPRPIVLTVGLRCGEQDVVLVATG